MTPIPITENILQEVNNTVNTITTYQMPIGEYKWENSDDAGFIGMCADQAIAKWERLFALGIGKENMRFAIVGVEQPGDHMILCARCDANSVWWALDIRYPYLMAPADLPYTWTEWGKSFNKNEWTSVNWRQTNG